MSTSLYVAMVLGVVVLAAEIAGAAMSTTSLAVVYAVLVETGLNRTEIGKAIMAATFVTDIGTAIALTALFVKPTLWMLPFAGASVALIALMPRLERWFFHRYGNRVIEPELKGAFAALLLMWLGDRAQSHAVLPAVVPTAIAQPFFSPRHAAVELGPPAAIPPELATRLAMEEDNPT